MMKVVPGPNASDNRFGFRVDGKTKVVCTHGEPAELKTEKEKAMAKQYINDGFLQLAPKKPAPEKEAEKGNVPS